MNPNQQFKRIPQINAVASDIPNQPVANHTTHQVVLISPPPNHVIKENVIPIKEAKPRIQDLVKELDPDEYLDHGVEELLLQMADDFIEFAVTGACALAKHRKSDNVGLKDVKLHLERNFNLHIPFVGSQISKTVPKNLCETAGLDPSKAVKLASSSGAKKAVRKRPAY